MHFGGHSPHSISIKWQERPPQIVQRILYACVHDMLLEACPPKSFEGLLGSMPNFEPEVCMLKLPLVLLGAAPGRQLVGHVKSV